MQAYLGPWKECCRPNAGTGRVLDYFLTSLRCMPACHLSPSCSRRAAGGQSGAGWCATAGLRHANLMQGPGQLWVQFNILKANTAISACRLSKREAFRSFEGWKPILRGTWEGARMKQPGAQCCFSALFIALTSKKGKRPKSLQSNLYETNQLTDCRISEWIIQDSLY